MMSGGTATVFRVWYLVCGCARHLSTLRGYFTTCPTLWLRVTVYDTNITNLNPKPRPIRPNQLLYKVSLVLFVSYTPFVNHDVE